MSEGKVFQSVGAATEKDLAPYVFKLKCGIESYRRHAGRIDPLPSALFLFLGSCLSLSLYFSYK